jgi:hypothetical protein
MCTKTTLTNFDFEVSTLKRMFGSLNPRKSPGPDNIHPYVLKATADTISNPLALLYTKFGTMAQAWKEANITSNLQKR